MTPFMDSASVTPADRGTQSVTVYNRCVKQFQVLCLETMIRNLGLELSIDLHEEHPGPNAVICSIGIANLNPSIL